ncbi:hypothetical protein [Halogeometricum sp. CBA1124]|uniref:hypothetical protein n=1 Tax=Halogeometricum sp. CBA1124 TaxID=2668071 RepID=UPI00142BA889|nr:hypothetical protein [Halogeometricum sp. CBA1124]MUV56725.1 hypothetical protein [Halogeometricum sp. CBA1124]
MDYFDYLDGFSTEEIEELLEQSQEKEQQRIKNELQRIDQELESRETIHEDIIKELESKINWYTERLNLVYKRTGNPSRIEELKKSLRKFYRELREEQRQNWRDRENLEESRRELLSELDELEDGDLTDLL